MVLSGIQANNSGWDPYSFYPNNGVVGELIGEAQCYEGTIYIVKCGERLLVPVLPSGINIISLAEFKSRYPRNMQIGKSTNQQMSNIINIDEMWDTLEYMHRKNK